MIDRIEAFTLMLTSERGFSPHTVEAYVRDARQLLAFVEKENIKASFAKASIVLNSESLLSYLEYLHDKQVESATLARKMAAIKLFCRFLYREKECEEDFGALLESPAIWQKVPNVLTEEEMKKILLVPDEKTPIGIRDRAILELLYATGIRVSELVGLSIYDVGDDAIRVMGKGRKERLVPVGAYALQAVDRYLHEVRSLYESEKNRSLFLSQKGKVITRIAVWRRIQEYAKQAGIMKAISPHTFRHSFASHLIDHGADVRVIQELLGHSQIATTDRYTHLTSKHIVDAFESFHPRW